MLGKILFLADEQAQYIHCHSLSSEVYPCSSQTFHRFLFQLNDHLLMKGFDYCYFKGQQDASLELGQNCSFFSKTYQRQPLLT